jgi:thioredoxin 1
VRSLPNDLNLENGTVVIKFFAEWCGPCRLYAPVFERMESRRPDLNFFELDIDKAPEIRDNFDVKSVPTTIILRDGHMIVNESGAKSTRQLDELVERALSYPDANSA